MPKYVFPLGIRSPIVAVLAVVIVVILPVMVVIIVVGPVVVIVVVTVSTIKNPGSVLWIKQNLWQHQILTID